MLAEKVGRAKKYLQLHGAEKKKKSKTQRKFTIVSLQDFKAAKASGKLGELRLATRVENAKADANMKGEESDD